MNRIWVVESNTVLGWKPKFFTYSEAIAKYQYHDELLLKKHYRLRPYVPEKARKK